MEQKCHDLTLTFLNNGESVCKESEFNPDALHEIKSKIDAEDLLTFAAVYGDDEWAMDVSCEGKDSYIVMIEIATGITYTFLNPQYSDLFEHYNSIHNIFVCSNMDEFEQDEKNREALTLSEINGNDCPLLHICDNKHDLFEIIMSFINTGSMYSGKKRTIIPIIWSMPE